MKAKGRPLLLTLLLALLSLPAAAQEDDIEIRLRRLERDSTSPAALKEAGMLHLHQADFDGALRCGTRLQQLVSERDPSELHYSTYAHIILGQAYIMKGDRVLALSNLEQARAKAEKAKNDTALCSVWNGLGLYASNLDNDYYRAISCFYEGIEAARRCRNDRLYSILLSNLASIYYLKKDTAGLRCAEECYELGHERKDIYLIRIGSEMAAFMHYLLHHYAKALNYIKEAEFIVLQNGYHNEAEIYVLYGMILTAMGQPGAALEYFDTALTYEPTGQTTAVLHAYIRYAEALIRLRRYSEAERMLQQGERYADENNVFIYRNDLHEMLSRLYEETGQYEKALAYHKVFLREQDSLFSLSKEHALNDLRIKFNVQKLENDINEARIEQLRRKRRTELLGGCTGAVVLIALLLLALYRRKNKLYRAIVQQNQQSIRREQQLQQQIEQLKEEEEEAARYTGSPLSTEQAGDLFSRLETLMREQRVYTDNQITKDKVSDLLETNRTYLSQVINERTGKTFTQYVNEFRTREAVRRLSDPGEALPLKALATELGFNSMTTFYTLFQAMTGMTPAQYRSSVRELDKS